MATTIPYSTLRAQLDTDLRDTDNFTFSAAEKDEALRKAIEDDPYCFDIEIDNATLVTPNTSSYPAPFDTITDIAIDGYQNGSPVFLSSSLWEQVGDSVIFDNSLTYLPTGDTLIFYGTNSFTATVGVPRTHRAYVINLAIAHTLDLLLEGKVNRFLRNDTSLAELMQVRTNKLKDAQALLKAIPNRRTMRF